MSTKPGRRCPPAVEHPGVERRRGRADEDLPDSRALDDDGRAFDRAVRHPVEHAHVPDDEETHLPREPLAQPAAAGASRSARFDVARHRRSGLHQGDVQPAAVSVSSGMMSRAAMTGRGDVPMRELPDDGEQHVGLFRIHARAAGDHVDGGAGGILGRFLHRRAEAEDLDGAVHLDDRARHRSPLVEGDARPHGRRALDAGARDDAVADRGVRVGEEHEGARHHDREMRPGSRP